MKLLVGTAPSRRKRGRSIRLNDLILGLLLLMCGAFVMTTLRPRVTRYEAKWGLPSRGLADEASDFGTAADEAQLKTVIGTVKRLNAVRLIVTVPESGVFELSRLPSNDYEFSVRGAIVEADGETASIRDLRIGDGVVVVYRERGGEMIATSVTVDRRSDETTESR